MKQLNFSYEKSSLVPVDEIKKLIGKLESLDLKLKDEFKKKYESDYAFAYCPFDDQNLKIVHESIEKKKKLAPTVLVVIGIGGSNLGTIAIHEAINGKFYNQNSSSNLEDLKVYFADTVDSDYISNICDLVEQELKAGNNIIINIISKSGTTTESIANFEVFLNLLKAYKPKDFNDYVVATTDKDSLLWGYAKSINCDILEIPKKVGGRYSVLSSVGLFPLGILGINIQDLLVGAQEVQKEYAAISAAILFYHYNNGINIHDTFLFSSNLESLGKWYRQLMGESIGKEGKGITPIVSIGSTDLHSVLQLNLAGPIDKFTTFLNIENNFTNLKIPIFNEFEKIVSNIQGLEFYKLINAISSGTKEAYIKKGRPFCEIKLKDKTERSLGNFLQFKMFEIVYLAYLLEINAFDQPNVEIYKEQTRKILKAGL